MRTTLTARRLRRGRGRRLAVVLGAIVALAMATVGAAPASGTGNGHGSTVDIADLRIRPIPDGSGVPQLTATTATPTSPTPTLSDDYVEDEFLLSGTANTYSGPSTGPATKASGDNPYVTRVVVRYPKDPADFSGRVFLEPFNTTTGPDLDAIWRQIAPLLEANGDAWVGVSVRSTSAQELQAFDPVRYADLSIPVNDDAWDVLRQLGVVLRKGGEKSPLGDLRAEHLYMGGYSQSGVDTATFAQAFHDDTRTADGAAVFDGYLPAAHAATMTPLQTGSGLITEFEEGSMQPVDVPVVDIETQHDVQGWSREVLPGTFYTSAGGASVRRPDASSPTDKYRLYEITGASHSSSPADCGGTPSTFPGPLFVRAAAAELFRWAEQGKAPAKAPRIDIPTIDTVSKPEVDEDGNALGGVRSPFVDDALVQYQVQAGGSGLACTFAGTETPLAADVLASRYDDVDEYMRKFTKSLDETIDDGRLLKMDRAAILTAAREKAESLLPQ